MKGRISEQDGNGTGRGRVGRWARARGLAMLGMAALCVVFCGDMCLSGDSTTLPGDISSYYGKEHASPLIGGSFIRRIQPVYPWQFLECYMPNQFTGACSCPAGYVPLYVGFGQAWRDIPWDSSMEGFLCKKPDA